MAWAVGKGVWCGRGGVAAIAVGCGLCFAAGAARADQPGLRRIEQGVEDLDPLAISLLNLQPDLRQDVGFEHLYVNPADPGQFVRVSGAMYAVSPRTDYWATRDEVFAIVSPGTVFYIGKPPELTEPATEESEARDETRGLSGEGRAVTRQPVRVAEVVSSPPLALSAMEVEGAPVGERKNETGPTPRRVPVEVRPHDMSDLAYRAARLREIARGLSSK